MGNTGHAVLITESARSVGSADRAPEDDVLDEGLLAKLEEDWPIVLPPIRDGPRPDQPWYFLRPRAQLRRPDRYRAP